MYICVYIYIYIYIKWCASVNSKLLIYPLPSLPYQAPQSIEFSRQAYWSGLPFLSPGDLPNPGIEPRYLELQADSLSSGLPGKPYRYR